MKAGLIAFLIINSSALFSQPRKELIGRYHHSFFMYSYVLTLKDSSKYETLESTDLGSEWKTGTWVVRGQVVRLTPQKAIIEDVNRIKRAESIADAKEEVVVIETKGILILKRDTDLKLGKFK